MSIRQLLRKPLLHTSPPSSLSKSTSLRTPRHLHPSSSSSTTASSPAKSRARMDRVLDRLPKFLRPYTNGLRTAPVSHVVAFLILHEITAIVPLVGLASLFHYTRWLPDTWSEQEGGWIKEGMEKFGRYFGRKGWFGFERIENTTVEDSGVDAASVISGVKGGEEAFEGATAGKNWIVGERGGRILVEVATAYAITKVFLPARIVLSVWGTPWFAKTFVTRIGSSFGRKGRIIGQSAGGGVVGKGVKNI